MGVGYYLDKKPVVDRSKLMAFIKGGKQVQQKQKQTLSLPGLGCISPSAPGGGRSRRKRASRCAMAKWAAGDEIQDTEGRVGRKA